MLRRLPVAAVLFALSACSEKVVWQANEIFVTSLPDGATVERDGKVVGRTPVAVSLVTWDEENEPVEQATIRLDLRREGFGAVSRTIETATAPERLDVVLSPVFGEGEEPAPAPARDDAEGLYRVGAALQRNSRCEEAMEYLVEARKLAPKAPKPWRESGLCLAKLGDSLGAAEAFERYLLLEPTAEDGELLRKRAAKMRGEREIDLSTPTGAPGQ